MSEKETIYSSSVKYGGVFSFKDFYKFCYDWLSDETGLNVGEGKYVEKLSGDAKELEVEWEGKRKLTDFFRFIMKVKFQILGLKSVEFQRDNKKIKTNEGSVKVSVKGILERDYEGKFETTAFTKSLRALYEKWIIPSRIEEYEEKVIKDSDEFLGQAKAFLDLEGKSRH